MCAAGSLPALTQLTIRLDTRQLEIEESVLSCYVTSVDACGAFASEVMASASHCWWAVSWECHRGPVELPTNVLSLSHDPDA